jgi:hypothetical protein
MPLPRPQQSLLSGLGVAGAVLAAVVVTFALASGIIAYSLTSEEPLVASSTALVLDPLRTSDRSDTPLVLRRARAASTGVSARAASAPDRGGAAGAMSPARGRMAVSGGSGDAAAGASDGPTATAEPTPAILPRKPVGQALHDTTHAVTATTDTLARRLDATGDATRQLVHAAAERTAAALARLLGAPQG